MSLVVLGLSHHGAPAVPPRVRRPHPRGAHRARARRAALRARQRGRRRLHVQPHRGLRRVPRPSTGRSPTSPRRWPRRARSTAATSSRTCTSTTRSAASPTCSRSPPASTRWRSARPRSSGRSAAPSPAPSATATSAPASTRSSSRRCASRSGCTPRPASTSSAARSSRPASPVREAALGPVADLRRPRRRRRRHGRARRDDRRPRGRPHRRRRQPQPRPRALGRRARRRAPPVRSPSCRAALAEADVIVTSTGAPGRIVLLDDVAEAMAARGGRPQVYVDLALPHDVDLAVSELDGVTRVGLGELGEDLAAAGSAPQVADATDLVTAEVAAYLLERSSAAVAPTVTALRTRAGELVDLELRPPRAAHPRPQRRRARRGPPGRRAGRRQAAPHPDGPGQGARAGRPGRQLRPGPVRAVRPRPARRLRRLGPADAAGGGRMSTLRLGTRRSALATTQSDLGGRPPARPRPRGRARRGEHRGRPRPVDPARPARRHRRLRLRPARPPWPTGASTSPCTRSRTCPTDARRRR